MDSRSKTLERYRVPEKTNTEPLQLLAPKADPIENIITKVEESFKKPELSRQFLKLNRFWSFSVKEAETQYTNRRLAMKAANNKVIESFGFVFLQSELELQKLVTRGQLRIGNLSRSHLGNPKHAVSVSQHADICQPEQLRSGIIVLVKYMKGRIKYVDYTEEQSQLDPQPDFDCHMMRNSAAIDSSISTYEAFHSTQVYVYEYDDVDIKEFPSQILPIGAAYFIWNGGPLYGDITQDGGKSS